MAPPDMRDAIRRRPGMFVGGTDAHAVQQMVQVVLDNALDQYRAGRCRRIHVDQTEDVITVTDDGPGIPIVDDAGEPFLRRVLVHPHIPASTDDTPTRLAGVGLYAISALSAELSVRVVRDGLAHAVRSRRGLLDDEVAVTPTGETTGTTVCFRPDPDIFCVTRPHRGSLSARLEELAFLTPGLSLTWSFGPDAHAAQGLAHLVAMHAEHLEAPTVHARTRVGDIDVEIALAWHAAMHHAPEARIFSFVNFTPSRLHGTHVDGLLAGLDALEPVVGGTRALHAGLVAAVAVVLADVRYGNPTKDELLSPAAEPAVAAVTRDALRAWRDAHPEVAARVVARATALATR